VTSIGLVEDNRPSWIITNFYGTHTRLNEMLWCPYSGYTFWEFGWYGQFNTNPILSTV